VGAHLAQARELLRAGRTREAAPQYQFAIDLTRKPGVPGVGSSRPGDTSFAGDVGVRVAADAFIEVTRAALAHGDCQGAADTMRRATSALIAPERREEANKIQFEIARCFQSRR